MIDSIFFEKNIDKDNLYLYDGKIEEYFFSKYNSYGIDYVEQKLINFFGNGTINHSRFVLKFKSFLINDDYASNQILYFTEKFKEFLSNSYFMSLDEILIEMSNCIENRNVSDLTSLILLYEKQHNEKDCVYYEALYFYILVNLTSFSKKLRTVLYNIHNDYKQISIKYLTKNQTILDILLAFDINVIGDLTKIDSDVLACLFSLDGENIFAIADELIVDYFTNLESMVSSIFSVLDDKSYLVISKRYGFDDKQLTLEEIGVDLSVTRERIRQIELKAEHKLSSKIEVMKPLFESMFYQLGHGGMKYVPVEDLKLKCNNDELFNQIIVLLQLSDLNIKFDRTLQILYDNDISNPSDFVKETVAVYGNFIDKSYTDSFDKCELAVLKQNYKLYKNSIYIKKGTAVFDLFINIIEDIFPNGYKICNKDFYDKFCSEVSLRFGNDFDMPSQRAFEARLSEKAEMCLVDRGLYKSKRFCSEINSELLAKIIDFINQHTPVCNYRTIFISFKKDLIDIGIDNFYYLKGLLDPLLPDDLKPKRDYIQISSSEITSKEFMINYMRSFDNIFTIDDLKKQFNGVQDYVIYGVIYNEANNGLVSLSNHKFVYLDKICIDESVPSQLKSIIDNLFVSLGEDTLTDKKIYSRLSLTNTALFQKLKVVNNYFDLFSLIHTLFPDEYGYNRPLISKNKDKQTNSTELVYNYAKKLDGFTKKVIFDYKNKMHLGAIYSYLEFMESLSNEFVQINVDSMIKKEKVNLNEEQLKAINSVLNLVLMRNNKIELSSFNAYWMLPKLSYAWNKYLLVGIIRTYFEDKYQIENTQSYYDATDFIIRRIDK